MSSLLELSNDFEAARERVIAAYEKEVKRLRSIDGNGAALPAKALRAERPAATPKPKKKAAQAKAKPSAAVAASRQEQGRYIAYSRELPKKQKARLAAIYAEIKGDAEKAPVGARDKAVRQHKREVLEAKTSKAAPKSRPRARKPAPKAPAMLTEAVGDIQ